MTTDTTPAPIGADAHALRTQHIVSRSFLERMLSAMEGVIDVADRQTDEFESLRSCVVDLTLMLFKPEALRAPRGQVPAPAAVAGPDRQALIDVIAQGLSGTWHCLRVWEAWNVGTMSQDDFEPVYESDTPAELADAVMALLAAAPTTQAAPVAQGDAEQRSMDTRHAAIYRWIIQHTDEAAGVIDAWREDGEADTDELHDALAARAAKEGASHG